MHTARFSHSRLSAYQVILEALVRGDAVARALPRGYAKLADQLRRALLGAFLQFAEGAAREGADRKVRLRCARAEAGEAAAALDGVYGEDRKSVTITHAAAATTIASTAPMITFVSTPRLIARTEAPTQTTTVIKRIPMRVLARAPAPRAYVVASSRVTGTSAPHRSQTTRPSTTLALQPGPVHASHFDPSRPAFLSLARQLFPDDREITSLR